MNLKRTAQYFYLRLKRVQGSPRALATSAAMGAAIGITPTLPFHTVMILGGALLLRVNPLVALMASTIVSNPLTFVPHYYGAWWLGNKILPNRLSWEQIKNLLEQLQGHGLWHGLQTLGEIGMNTALVMLTGGVLLALPIALIFYLASFRFFVLLHHKKRQRHLLHHRPSKK
ncbi:DUF2062 domain-containing protein [Desulfogranum mediterraneum]|uniref:DUF2062 domain-containing protein n=1 Tax=Desulfogranum mediterraneum TaxID=160661 RepID=UPI0004119B98|nr:DUF2062 domain-containing protein [Desulfogranum mediterraneum]